MKIEKKEIEEKFDPLIIPIVAFFAILVFLVFAMGYGFDRNEKVRCLDLQKQASEYDEAYSKWAREFPETHALDITECHSYNVEIVIK